MTLLNPTGLSSAPRRPRLPHLVAALSPLLALALSGCTSLFIRTRAVHRTIIIDKVQTATLDELVSQIDAQYKAINSLNITKVEIAATSGGEHKGEVKQLPAFASFILLRKPADLTLIMQVPLVGSVAMEMVADGKDFKLIIPSQKKAITGSEVVAPTGTQTGLYSLRPSIIRDALLIPEIGPDELVTLTESSRITPPAPGRKESIEEPDYDVTVLHIKKGHTLERVRVIHIGRVTLKPYQQDIYDHEGRIVTTIVYDKWQKNGDFDFPMSLFVTRPIDEYTLKIDISRLSINQKLEDDQFVLPIPANYTIQKM